MSDGPAGIDIIPLHTENPSGGIQRNPEADRLIDAALRYSGNPGRNQFSVPSTNSGSPDLWDKTFKGIYTIPVSYTAKDIEILPEGTYAANIIYGENNESRGISLLSLDKTSARSGVDVKTLESLSKLFHDGLYKSGMAEIEFFDAKTQTIGSDSVVIGAKEEGTPEGYHGPFKLIQRPA